MSLQADETDTGIQTECRVGLFDLRGNQRGDHHVYRSFHHGLDLSADSFSAAVAMGGRKFRTGELLLFATTSGGAELLAVVAGYFAGAKVISLISAYDHWVAFGLLAAIAIHMFIEGVRELRSPSPQNNEAIGHSFFKMLFVAVATSLDAFGVGIGLGVAEKPIAPFAFSIGAWAFTSTIVGVFIGSRASKRLGPIFTIGASFVLGYLSIKMLEI